MESQLTGSAEGFFGLFAQYGAGALFGGVILVACLYFIKKFMESSAEQIKNMREDQKQMNLSHQETVKHLTSEYSGSVESLSSKYGDLITDITEKFLK